MHSTGRGAHNGGATIGTVGGLRYQTLNSAFGPHKALLIHIRVRNVPCPTITFLLSRVKPFVISTFHILQLIRLILDNGSGGAFSGILMPVVVAIAFPAAPAIAFHDAAFATMVLIRAVLRATSLRFAEEGFGCGDGGTKDSHVDFDHAPYVDGYAVEEGILRFRVDANRVEAHD